MAAHENEETKLLERITVDPKILGGKPIVRGRRLTVEHVLGMLAAGDDADTILAGYSRLEKEDIRACLIYAHRVISHERVSPEARVGYIIYEDDYQVVAEPFADTQTGLDG